MGRSVRSVAAVVLVLGWLLLVVSTSASAAPKRPPAKRPPAPPFGWTVDGLVVESLRPATHAVTTTGVGTYAGRVLLSRSPGGVAVVNELPFEDYVRGVSEMPNAWPGEALKAQAIAARTYALWDLAREVPPTIAPYKAVGADICATPSCQAYTGLAKTQAEHGERWAAAVDATKGQVLWWRDGPIAAKYSSSNGGRSIAGGQPYLRAIDDPDDRHSPLHRWQSTLSFVDIGRALGLAAVPTAVTRSGDTVVVTVAPTSTPTQTSMSTTGGGATATPPPSQPGDVPVTTAPPATAPQVTPPAVETVAVPVVDFRDRVNDAVPTPPGGLPRAVPSVRFDVAPADGAVVLHGRGWGHGIGMSQWGAFGKATRGMKAPDILATYYGGIRPAAVAGELLPEVIRVAVDIDRTAAEVGVTERGPVHEATPPSKHGQVRNKHGRFRVSTPDGTVLAHAATGMWRVVPLPKGGLRVIPPADQAEAARVEQLGTEPARPRAGQPVRLQVELAHPALVGATVTAATATASPVAVADARLVEAGHVRLELPPVPWPGTYTVNVTTDRGGGRTATTPFELQVGPPAGRGQLAVGSGGAGGLAGGDGGGLSVAGALAALVAAAGLAAVAVATTRSTLASRTHAGGGLGPEGDGPLH